RRQWKPTRRRNIAVPSLSEHAFSILSVSSSSTEQLSQQIFLVGEGYSLASYYTSLGLFIISVPGLWSLIKRSVKSKVL
ncbi:hypothetical protein M569_10610, partial [Genlisea aurea]